MKPHPTSDSRTSNPTSDTIFALTFLLASRCVNRIGNLSKAQGRRSAPRWRRRLRNATRRDVVCMWWDAGDATDTSRCRCHKQLTAGVERTPRCGALERATCALRMSPSLSWVHICLAVFRERTVGMLKAMVMGCAVTHKGHAFFLHNK